MPDDDKPKLEKRPADPRHLKTKSPLRHKVSRAFSILLLFKQRCFVGLLPGELLVTEMSVFRGLDILRFDEVEL